ncbi:YifB family Mg chelatase-like AAA ATPase [Bifidobacterium olomucense]|uniref:ATPase AAA n=1 Tax=Bifidobacterium olomucense TaxID=2675324 RepID=A0A7Y0EYC2_9BIFI|nr:YifB family Mg chelatase-like AAA ATPase [Bifidobacterium sp. DSM 109959]NMM97616.1 ATPase AAA [Bifidobacterium sp. DSM 109959]
MAIGSALSVGLIGLKAFVIQVQAFVSNGLPYFSIIGLPDASLAEARERVRSACQAAGFSWPQTRVTVNMSPAAMPKRGSSHDLAIAASVLCASGTIGHNSLEDTIVLGEVNLDGSVLPIHGLLPIMLHAQSHGIHKMIIPYRNLEESNMLDGLDVIGIRHVGELIELMGGQASYTIADTQLSDENPELSSCGKTIDANDMAEVLGQDHAKWALQVAAAGGHNLIMTGPPGAGKTMLAARLPGIMCPLAESEQLEVASIRSLCGTLPQYGITDLPPFEAPHHTATTAALVGGGSGIATPGAITRAHRGILFLDEAPEFSARSLQTLREPLESGYVSLSRSKGSTYYPASFQLIMAANPCPCGYYYGTGERCSCREKDRIRYFSRLSGPILDRIDIQLSVPPVSRIAVANEPPGETSAVIRQRVTHARNTAKDRFRKQGWTCNAQASGTWLHANTSLKAMELVNQALASYRITLRGADRAMRLAWTFADLAGRTSPSTQDVHQGIEMRTRMT